MKKKLSLLIALSALTLSVGAAVGVGAGVKSAESAQAATTSPANTMTIYILANSEVNMGSGAANCGIALWNAADANAKVFYDATRVGGTLFSCSISTEYDTIDVVRTRTDKSLVTDGWDAKYNDTGAITFDSSKNAIKLTGWSGSEMTNEYTDVSNSYQTVPSGTRYYIDLVHVNSWWYNDGYETYMTFQTSGDYYGSYQHWYKANRIVNTDLHYVDIVDGLVCSWAIVVRTNGYTWGPNQTANITDVSDRIIVSPSGEGSKSMSYDFGHIENNDNHLSWLFCHYFLSLNLCLDAGGLHEDVATNWANAKATYSNVKDALINKDAVKNIEANQESEDEGQRAMARYDAVISKNPEYRTAENNFIGRNVTPSVTSYIFSNVEETTNYTAVIILASSLALIAVGGYFLLRKARKED